MTFPSVIRRFFGVSAARALMRRKPFKAVKVGKPFQKRSV